MGDINSLYMTFTSGTAHMARDSLHLYSYKAVRRPNDVHDVVIRISDRLHESRPVALVHLPYVNFSFREFYVR